MKKLAILTILAIAGFAVQAQDLNVFNHLSIGVSAGTNGIGVQFATPLTRWAAVRGEVSFMPGITYHTDADVSFTDPADNPGHATIDLDCGLARTQGALLVNLYPLPKGAFYVSAGAYFGGSKLIKIKGHSDALKNMNGSIEVGDFNIPVDNDGNVKGGLEVNSFRPYLGIGWGRAVPGRRVNFSVDLGVQFHGTPKVYSESGELTRLSAGLDDDNDFKKIVDNLKVYPVLTFRIAGRIF